MYIALAKHYDLFMKDSGHQERLDFVLRFLTAEHKSGADLACGTGAVTIALAQKGFDIYGVDYSAEMLRQADSNAKKCGANIKFICQDINNFKALKPLDFVTCVCDGVNYLKNPSKMFNAVFAALKKGGLFIFDISTEYKLKEVLSDNTFSETDGGVTYIWKNSLSKNKDRVDMHLMFFEQFGDMYKRSEEFQTQYAHSLKSLCDLLSAGYNVKIYGEKGKNPPKPTDGRAYFVAVKK